MPCSKWACNLFWPPAAKIRQFDIKLSFISNNEYNRVKNCYKIGIFLSEVLIRSMLFIKRVTPFELYINAWYDERELNRKTIL